MTPSTPAWIAVAVRLSDGAVVARSALIPTTDDPYDTATAASAASRAIVLLLRPPAYAVAVGEVGSEWLDAWLLERGAIKNLK